MKAEDNAYPYLRLVRQISTPPDAPADSLYLFIDDADGLVYLVDETGTIVAVGGGGGGGDVAHQPEALMIAVSNETTDLATGAAQITFRMPFAFTLTEVRASLTAASSAAGPVAVDVNEGGVSVFSTGLTIDDTETTSTTATTPAVISDASLADDAQVTVDIDNAGTGAKGLKLTLIGTRT